MEIGDIGISAKKIMDLLEQHLGKTSEIVLHDLTLPYDRTIIDIRNSEITGRKVQDCGSNVGLEVMRGTVKDGDRFNYVTHTKDGKILRSSTLFIKDEENKVVGAICVNTDISEMVRFETYLHEQVGSYNSAVQPISNTEELFAHNVNELLDFFMQEGQKIVGKAAPMMDKEDKLRFLDYLDKKGAFLITKSSEHICGFLNISKFTLYNYLETVRSANSTQNDT